MKIITAILILLSVITLHELGHFVAAKLMGIGVEGVSIGIGRPMFQRNIGGTEYAIRIIPVAAFVKVAVEQEKCRPGEISLQNAGGVRKVALYLAGPITNFALVYVAVGLLLLIGYPMPPAVFGSITSGSVLERAGLSSGDHIVSVNGRPVATSAEFNVTMGYGSGSHKVLLSDGRTVVVPAAPGVNIKASWQPVGQMVLRSSRSITEIADVATFTLKRLVWQNYVGLKAIIGGQAKDLSGPVGQVQIVSSLLRKDVYTPLMLFAVLSVALGCLNLVPLPITDGGQAMLATVEAILGSLPATVIKAWNATGIVLMMLLFAWTSFADMIRLLSTR